MFSSWYVEVMDEAPIARHVAESVRRARTAKRCDRCPIWIEPGQDYRRAFWLVDGEPVVEARHVAACAGWELHGP